jgi:hypothetical protein
MTAQPSGPAHGPDTGPHEVIHLGGHAAVVVPVADFIWLRALERLASAQETAGRCGAAGVAGAGGSWPELLRARRPRMAAAGPDRVKLSGHLRGEGDRSGAGFLADDPAGLGTVLDASTGWPVIPARPSRSRTGRRTCGSCGPAGTG